MSPREGYDHLLDRYARVFGAAIRRVCKGRHQQLIPDVEQEIRLALWKRLQKDEAIHNPSSYLYKMALTTAALVVRRHRYENELPETLADGTLGPGAARGLMPPEASRLLDQLTITLPEEQRRAVAAYAAGFNHHEIAHLYGWTPSVARHRIYRGLDALRAHYPPSKTRRTELPVTRSAVSESGA